MPYSVRDMDVPVIKEQQVLTIHVQKSISEVDECGTKAAEIILSAACRIRDPIANSKTERCKQRSENRRWSTNTATL